MHLVCLQLDFIANVTGWWLSTPSSFESIISLICFAASEAELFLFIHSIGSFSPFVVQVSIEVNEERKCLMPGDMCNAPA